MRVLILKDLEKIHNIKKSERYIEFQRVFEPVQIRENHFHRKSEELRQFCKTKEWQGEEKKIN